MNTEYTRRSVLAVGALALIDTTMARGRTATAKARGGALQPEGSKTRVASCNCGQLRATCKGPDPERISLCHCNLCQKQSGSAFAIQARYPKEQVAIEGRSTAWNIPLEAAKALPYRNCVVAGGGGTFYFCPVCGSTVWYTADADDSRIGIKIGAFADPTFPAPKVSGFEAYRHPWAMKAADVPMQHVD